MTNKTLQLSLFKLKGCLSCNQIETIINGIVTETRNYSEISIKYIEILSIEDLIRLKVNIKLFPTLLAYKNNKLRLGWEGFAALAPDEIKREMVEDVLRQVAALADEDSGAGETDEMTQQVRHDNESAN